MIECDPIHRVPTTGFEPVRSGLQPEALPTELRGLTPGRGKATLASYFSHSAFNGAGLAGFEPAPSGLTIPGSTVELQAKDVTYPGRESNP